MEYSSSGDEFHVGVITQLDNSPHSLLVTASEPDTVQFAVTVRDPPYERNATVQPGSTVSITLPPPSNAVQKEGEVYILTVASQQISVFVPMLQVVSLRFFHAKQQIDVGSAPALGVSKEQPLTRSTLLLVGCQDATSIKVDSTFTISLPADLNPTTIDLPSGGTVTSFHINHLKTVTIHQRCTENIHCG